MRVILRDRQTLVDGGREGGSLGKLQGLVGVGRGARKCGFVVGHGPAPKYKYSHRQCSKSLVTLERLNRHVVIHSEATPFSCDRCSWTFKRKDSLA